MSEALSESAKERGIAAWVTFIRGAAKAHNSTVPDRIERRWVVGRWDVKYERRSKKEFWGRFGGGWNWHFGVQVGGSTVLIFLFVAMIRISRVKNG